MTVELRDRDIQCSENRVARIMARHGISGRCKTAFRPRTTVADPDKRPSPNRLKDLGEPSAPGEIYVSDIADVATRQGWLYLAFVLDLYSRKVAGWAFADHMETRLVTTALNRAISAVPPAMGGLFHSDRGCQDTSRKMRERLAGFNLELHPDKTRLIEIGRYADANHKRRGRGKPETFDFLGFTHYCAKTGTNQKFIVGRKTQSKRMRTKLKQLKEELRRRMHRPVPETGQWLRRVVQGYYNYHSVPRNGAAIKAFTRALLKHWWKSLRRRSHKSNCDWQRFYHRIARRWMPPLRVMHPYPEHRLIVKTRGRSLVR